MPRQAKSSRSGSTANIGFEVKLWLAADKLRNNMDAAEYIIGHESELVSREYTHMDDETKRKAIRKLPALL